MNLKDNIIQTLCFIKDGRVNISSSKLRKIDTITLKEISDRTAFLNELNPSTSDRIKYILNDRYALNDCLHCKQKMLSIDHKFCSAKCNNNSEFTKAKFREAYNSLSKSDKDARNEKRKTTVEAKYGGYTLQSPELRNKVKATMISKYGTDRLFDIPEIKQAAIDSWIKKYGVSNPFKATEIKEKIKKILFERYGVVNAANVDPNRIDKVMETKVAKGLVIPDEFLSDYKLYRKRVKNITEKTYKLHKDIVNPYGFKRVTNGNDGYQLDHKYSILEGFLNDVSPEIIGSVHNLEMLWWKDNLLKSKKCTITLDELLKKQ